ncbi:MAG: SDR family oxidoreductase [Tenericutes bacterium]|nr:SDR family oxidoreductase [Mycoplasmatota bacterium]
MNLEGQVALVTGSTSPLGSEIIRVLAKEGTNVVIHYHNKEEEAYALEQEIKNTYNIDTYVIKCDITDENEVKKMVDKVINKYKKIDILVNNSAYTKDSPYEEKTSESFKKILDVNIIGTFLVTKYVGRTMLLNKKGKIINISSNNAINCYYPESIDYDASKAGIVSMTKNMALYYKPYINVNCICPGWIDTDINVNLDKKFKEEEKNKIYLHRFAKTEEIANVVVFLASDKASYINNTIIKVDGGTNG